MPNHLQRLREFGQSPWLDFIDRALLAKGELKRLIQEDGICGLTSNPTIFEKAIGGGTDYDEDIARLLREHPDAMPREIFYRLAVQDIRAAADTLWPVYEAAEGHDGLVSLEVSPDLAHDTEATVEEARRLFRHVDRRNLMIKVPATRAGLPAIETLIAEGINVNVTLLFSVERYRAVVGAYLQGLQRRRAAGEPLDHVASVASFFVSRVDTLVDDLLAKRAAEDPERREDYEALMGTLAIANAKAAYRHYQAAFDGEDFAPLRAAGAQTQRLLWASTGTKNARYSDVLYVDNLIGPDTVNTLPPQTLKAFREHGDPAPRLMEGMDEALDRLRRLDALGVDLGAATDRLEAEGVEAFAQSFRSLLDTVAAHSRRLEQRARA
ncbi:transaldolase [Ectothiorhodospiraceae bacterium 2226]|nr:transaldolase [Ectothiorhodospiraceae bacterium 2226]